MKDHKLVYTGSQPINTTCKDCGKIREGTATSMEAFCRCNEESIDKIRELEDRIAFLERFLSIK